MARSTRAGRRRDLGAQVGDAVGLLRGAGRAQPLGLPVAVAQRRGEARRRRDRSPRPPRRPGLDGPLRRRRRRRAPARRRHEGLPGRGHGAAVPDDARRGPGRCGAPRCGTPSGPRRRARRLQRPGERAVVGVDPHRVGQAVDRERTGPQRPGGTVPRHRARRAARRRAARRPAPPRRRSAPAATAPAATPRRRGEEGAAAEAAHGVPAPDPTTRTVSRPASAKNSAPDVDTATPVGVPMRA